MRSGSLQLLTKCNLVIQASFKTREVNKVPTLKNACCARRGGREKTEIIREVNSYTHLSLVRKNHHRGEYHTSSYKEGGFRFLLTNPKLRKKAALTWYAPEWIRAKKVALASN